VLAGFGGRTDAVISYLITTRLAMPVVLVALAMASLVGGSLKVVIVLLGLLLWDRFAVVRARPHAALRDMVAAARPSGATPTSCCARSCPTSWGR
jgi:peptide/nickel transport system permease protein